MTPFIPTTGDWAIIIGGIIVLGGAVAWAASFLIVRLVRFVGWKMCVGWFAITAFLVLSAVAVFGR